LKVLITGVAGFIGSFVAERLLADGWEVLGLDSFDDYYAPSIKRANLRGVSSSPRFRLTEGDFRDEALLESLFGEHGPQAVVHLGARAGVRPSLLKAALYADVNVTGTTRLLEACRRHGVEKFLFASSSSVYGKRPLEPFGEEDSADHPLSPYAATKRAGELICHTYHHLFGLDVTCLRFFTVYGPRQRPEMAIHSFTRSIAAGKPIAVFGDGSARRDFTYISDTVDGVARALERCRGYRIFNLGNSNTVELREVIGLIERELGRKAKIENLPEEPGDVPVTFADIRRAREELGYQPRVSIAEGIRSFVRWFEREGSRGD
jgi:UDP-glucuronate 4-epimerase